MDTRTLRTLPYATGTTAIADSLHTRHAPRNMKIIPGGHPSTTGVKLSVDTLHSTPPGENHKELT